jgi:hypothetical protein
MELHTEATVLPDDDLMGKEPTLLSDEQFAEITEAKEPQNAAQEPPPQPETPQEEADVPQPLRGKSKAEIARMLAEAQTLIGRQGNELGTLRQYADTFIKQDMQRKLAPREAPQPAKEPEDVDFFADPKKAIAAAVAQHPDVARLRDENRALSEHVTTTRRERAQEAFAKRHPDAGDVLQDPGFAEWVMKSQVRQALLRRADQQWDVMAADELFGTWKELSAVRAEQKAAAADAAEKANKVAARAAEVPSSGNARPANGGEGKKIYRRADILKLMETDRDRYEMLSDEISRAYAEGRVR